MAGRKENVAAASAAAMPAQAAPAPLRNSQLTPYIAMSLIIAVVFLLGWGVSNALQARGEEQEVLTVPGKSKPNLMATAEAPKGMPDKVRDWLEHLRRCEERKNRLSAEQVAQVKMSITKFQALGPAAGLLDQGADDDMTNPVAPVEKMTTDLSEPWDKLIKDFQAVPPPEECQKLADEYFSAINEIPAQMRDIQELLSNLTAAMSGAPPTTGETQANKDALRDAQSLQGKSSESIDSHFLTADGLLTDVCAQYNTRKWFAISSDFGSGLLSTPF